MPTSSTLSPITAPVQGERLDARCFKCSGRLRSYHRSGLALELCEDCRGIYLDGGELELLIEAEGGGWSGRIGSPWPAIEMTNDGEPVSAGR